MERGAASFKGAYANPLSRTASNIYVAYLLARSLLGCPEEARDDRHLEVFPL
jgi:hypothetical protein